jgi:hypothetical protein
LNLVNDCQKLKQTLLAQARPKGVAPTTQNFAFLGAGD